MNKTIFLTVLILTLITSASPADTNWTGSISSSWNEPGNWSAGVPDASNSAISSWHVNASSFPNNLVIDSNVNGTFYKAHIENGTVSMTGGKLDGKNSLYNQLYVGRNNTTGIFNMTGGQWIMNGAERHMFIADGSGSKGTVNISSTAVFTANCDIFIPGHTTAGTAKLNVFGTGRLDCRDLFVRGSGGSGTGTVTISENGVINCRFINFTGPSGVVNLTSGTINCSSGLYFLDGLVDITGGILITGGDDTALISSVAGSMIIGHDGIERGWTYTGSFGSLYWDYNHVNPGKTTVWAMPPATIKASNPSPGHSMTGVEADSVLTWSAGIYAASVSGHDVYFGTNLAAVTNATPSNPQGVYIARQTPASFAPALDYGKTYYWRIDEVNGTNIWTGDVWKFTTEEGKAVNPSPQNNGLVDLYWYNDDLQWTPSEDASAQDIYFGTSYDDVNNSTTPLSAALSADANSFNIPSDLLPLDYNSVYYWRVDSNNAGALVKGSIWSFRVLPKLEYGDITFLAFGDSHYRSDPALNITMNATLDKMNSIIGTSFPPALGGGLVRTPFGVIGAGDLTDSAQAAEWAQYILDYGVNTEGRCNYPVYDGYGNHDNGTAVLNGLIARNPLRQNLRSIYSSSDTGNGLHYSWDWDNVHFIHINVYAGNEDTPTTSVPRYSLQFLLYDLANNVGNSLRPIVIVQHFPPAADPSDAEEQAFYDAIAGYNVIAILHGHVHGAEFYQWRGFDVYNVGSPSGRQEFTVFHITGNKLIVANRYSATDTWGITKQKTFPVPADGDFNCDGRIDTEDLKFLTSGWQTGGTHMIKDLFKDGSIDFRDLAVFADSWLTGS